MEHYPSVSNYLPFSKYEFKGQLAVYLREGILQEITSVKQEFQNLWCSTEDLNYKKPMTIGKATNTQVHWLTIRQISQSSSKYYAPQNLHQFHEHNYIPWSLQFDEPYWSFTVFKMKEERQDSNVDILKYIHLLQNIFILGFLQMTDRALITTVLQLFGNEIASRFGNTFTSFQDNQIVIFLMDHLKSRAQLTQ